ncbi:hypothetical protein KCU87_g267, partial [Aureobasidium melanogenum]
MSRGSELAIGRKRNAHAETAFCLVLAEFGGAFAGGGKERRPRARLRSSLVLSLSRLLAIGANSDVVGTEFVRILQGLN